MTNNKYTEIPCIMTRKECQEILHVSKSTMLKLIKEGAISSSLFFARPFWTKLQNIFGHCCMSKLDKVAKCWLAFNRPAEQAMQTL